MAEFSDLITLCSVKVEQVTTGPRVTTLKVLSWLTLSLMLFAKKPKTVIAFRFEFLRKFQLFADLYICF